MMLRPLSFEILSLTMYSASLKPGNVTKCSDISFLNALNKKTGRQKAYIPQYLAQIFSYDTKPPIRAAYLSVPEKALLLKG